MQVWNFNLRHLRAAAEIVRHGTINAAAGAVSLTQPAITQALVRLEAQLGQPLFARRHDGMEPTEAARLLARRIGNAVRLIGSPRVTMAQMRAMVALADHGSYSVASGALGLAEPTLHRSVGNLAVALRAVLVECRGKGIVLTDAGRRVARTFRLARAEIEAGLTEIAALRGQETGRIGVGAMPLSRARLLPAAIAAFHRSHPEVCINVLEGSFDELIEPLRDGDIDLMIGALRDPAPGKDLVQHALFEDRPAIIGRVGHPVGRNPELAAMARFAWIMPPPRTPLRQQWERMFASAGIAPPSVPIECGSVIIIRQLLMEGDFLTILSVDQIAVELEARWLELIAIVPQGQTRTIGYTTRDGWLPTARQAEFAALLTDLASGT